MDETATSDTQSETQNVSDPTTATVTTPGSSETQETTTSNDDLQERFKRMEAALRKANSEAKGHRLEADELKKFKELTEAEKLSDTEKQSLSQKKLEQQLSGHQSQNSALLKQLQEAKINNEVFKQASKLNIIDIDAASKLIDASRIEYDESGNPTNVDALLKELAKARPWLTGKPQAQQTSGGATNPSRSQTSGPQTITKEYVQEVQRGGKAAWDALAEGERQRIRRFTASGGLFKK